MPYTLRWALENQVAYVAFAGQVDMADIHAANVEILALLDQAAGKIHILDNLTDVTKMEVRIPVLMKDQVVAKVSTHPNLGTVVYFDRKNAFFNFLVTLLGRNYHETIRIFDSEAEATAYVEELIGSKLSQNRETQ